MVTWDDVREIAGMMPEVLEADGEHPKWTVRGTSIAWDRPLRKGDLQHLGAAAPTGPILGVRVDGLDVKDELLRVEAPALFTTPHFDGYPAVLVQLDLVDRALLEELLLDAWFDLAPKRLAAAFRAQLDAG